jgi:hypothetical protein
LIDEKNLNRLIVEMDRREIIGFDINSGRFEIDLPYSNVTMRGIKNFLLELQAALNSPNSGEYIKPRNKETVFSFFYTKHFLHNIYRKFVMGESIVNTFSIIYNGENYSIFELYALRGRGELDCDIQEILLDEQNIESYWVINFFGFNPHAPSETHPFNYENSASEPSTHIQMREKNDKKDRLIWNLLCNGTSEYSDKEFVKNLMIEEVFSKPNDEQAEAFDSMYSKIYHGTVGKSGNSTIQRMGGVGFFTELFRAFSLTDSKSEDLQNLIDFYFRYKNVTTIDSQLIEALQYCRFDNRATLINLLNRFNALTVVGNMNNHKTYKAFLACFIDALNRLGYTYSHMPETLRKSECHKKVYEDALWWLANDIEKIEQTKLPGILQDVEILKKFLEVNKEIIAHSMTLSVPEPRLTMDFQSSRSDESKRLEIYQRNHSEEESIEEFNKSYMVGNISAQEIMLLQKKQT